MADEPQFSPRCWAVVPAAGIGQRMGGETPKQYMPLLGRPIIAHTLARFCDHARIAGVVVALAADDRWWSGVEATFAHPPMTVIGGRQRRDSVLRGLEALADRADPADWVLVHDAVRPCLREEDVDRLIDALVDDEVGGLLAIPVKDTMKRASSDNRVRETVSRESLWHAQTPQMFRLGRLRDAMLLSTDEDRDVTDEAQAMELTGARPRLVPGQEDNIKITRPEDLKLAEFILMNREDNP